MVLSIRLGRRSVVKNVRGGQGRGTLGSVLQDELAARLPAAERCRELLADTPTGQGTRDIMKVGEPN